MARQVNRVIYIAHFLYWLRVHRSWSSAKWVMEFEGRAWRQTRRLAETEGFEPSVRGRAPVVNAEPIPK